MIFVECYADLALVTFLTALPKRAIVHDLKGKPGVLRQLRKHADCKGMVDEDPFSLQHSYMKLAKLAQELPQCNLRLLRDESRNNYIIVLCPRL